MLRKEVNKGRCKLGKVPKLGLKYYKDLQHKIPKMEITHFKII